MHPETTERFGRPLHCTRVTTTLRILLGCTSSSRTTAWRGGCCTNTPLRTTFSSGLTASSRPFLYFPLRHHFEQNMHVAHRLDRYGAGRRMDFDTADPDLIAAAIAEEIARPARYREVETEGARRAAEKLAELL